MRKTPRTLVPVSSCCREVRLNFMGPILPAVGTVVSGFDTHEGRMRHYRVVRHHADWNNVEVVEETSGEP